jgi:integrase
VKYTLDDPAAKGEGVIWLRYTVAGKRIETSLRTADTAVAQKQQDTIMRPLELASTKEALMQVEVRLKQTQLEERKEWEKKNPPMNLDEVWNAYLKSSERPDSGDDTLRHYKMYWMGFMNWLKKNYPDIECLCEVTSELAQKYAAQMTSRGLSANTYNKHTSFLRLIFRVLTEVAQVRKNPFEKIRRKKLKTNARRELTIAELKDILEKAEGELQTLLFIGTFTGLRLGDCCTLKWGEVDLERGLIRRVQNKTASKKQTPVLIGIPGALSTKLSETSAEHRKGYVVKRYAGLYTYRNKSGAPNYQAQITREIQDHFTKCGIQTHKEGTGVIKDENGDNVSTGKRAVVEVGFHSLRHTFVSLHAEHGTPQSVVQAIVGHGSPAMTSHYTHIGEATARRVADVLDISDENSSDHKNLTTPSKALPAPFVETVKAPTSLRAQKKVLGIKCLVLRISGGQNENMKAHLLKDLDELEELLKTPCPAIPRRGGIRRPPAS